MIYTLRIEEFAIGQSSVPSARDTMFKYDQGKLHKIVVQIKDLFLPRLPGM